MGRTADAVAEGVIIAIAAARLSIRNRILVDAIRNDSAFSFDALKPFARQTLEALADEQSAAADRIGVGRGESSPTRVAPTTTGAVTHGICAAERASTPESRKNSASAQPTRQVSST